MLVYILNLFFMKSFVMSYFVKYDLYDGIAAGSDLSTKV